MPTDDPPTWCWPAAAAGTRRSTGPPPQVPAGRRLHLRPGYLPLEMLAGLLGGAELVVYPSLGEGFGLPVLEAMACGAPVLTTRRLALPEVGGDAVAYTGPTTRRRSRTAASPRPAGRPGPPGRRSPPRAGPAPRAFDWRSCARAHLPAPDAAGSGRATVGAGALRVVAVTYSPGEALDGFCPSLGGRPTRPVEVVLADNGSTDGAPERIAAALRRTSGCCGPAATSGTAPRRTPALADLTSGYALVANPDIRFEPGAVDELLAAAAALAPGRDRRARRSARRTAQLYPSARDLPPLSTGVGHALLGWVWPANPWTARYRREREAPRERTAGWLSGSCLLVDLEAFWSVGGLRPRLLHVLRGRRSRRAAEPPRMAARVRAVGGRRSTRAGTPRAGSRTACSGSTTPAPCATCPASTRGGGRRRCARPSAPDSGARMLISYVSGRVAAGARFAAPRG